MSQVEAKSSGSTITIANGATDSSSIALGSYAQCGFILPAAFTGTAVSFKVSLDNSTFTALYDSANALVSVTVTQGRAYAFPISTFPFLFIKLVSNGAEGAARSITIASKY